jgi:hypothetical protein
MLRREALVRSDVSEERIASIIRVKGIKELGTTSDVTSNSVDYCCFSTLPRKESIQLEVSYID